MGNDSVDLLVKLAMDAKKYGKQLKSTAGKTATWAKGVAGSIASFAGPAVLGGITAVGTAVAGIGIASVNMASQVKQSQKDLQAELGVTAEEAEHLSDIAVDVFGHNFYNSVEEAAGAVAEVRKQLGDLSDKELQDAAENAHRIYKTFDVDIVDSLNAAKVLTEKFGISQEEAFDLITTGFQRGLDSSGDFLDSITEYGNLFAENGAGADEFFSILETGLQGGVLGTDKAADLFKEFGISIRESGEFTGNIADDFNRLRTELLAIEDPVARNARGVELFGTMWTDLGESAVLGLDPAKTALEETAGATDTLNAKYENFGALLEGIKRQALIAISPIGEEILKIANDAMPKIQEAITQAMPIIQDFAVEFAENLGPALNTALANLRGIADAMGLTTEETTDTEAAILLLTESLDGLITVFVTLTSWGNSLVSFWANWGEAIKGVLNPLGSLLENVRRLDQDLQDLTSSLPDWMTPGSPTPLEIGIKGINAAIKQMPTVDFGVNANMGNIATSGASDSGGSLSFGDININGGNIDIDEATRQFASLLRNKLNGGGQ